MRFRIEQLFPGPLDEVEAALCDPGFLERLSDLPKLGRPQLLDQRVDGDLVHQRVRYAFTGHLPSAATAVVDPKKLTWVEESTLDRSTHRARLKIVPDHYPDRLRCEGVYQLSPADGGTRRVLEGDLTVRLRLVGGRVERAIISGLEEHADEEAEVMGSYLTQQEG